MGNQQGLEQGGGRNNNPSQLALDINERAATAAVGIHLDGRRGMKMVEGPTRGQFALQQKDEDKMPCMIAVDSADIDGQVLTHKVAELLKDQRTVRIPGGVGQIFGVHPDKKEVFSIKYHYMSPIEISKSFSKTDDVFLDAPLGTRIEFTSVTYKGRDFTSEAQTLLLGKRELQLNAGSVESALCGRMIIDSSAGDFHFLYKLHSTPSEHISCLLSELFYIPPSRSYEMPRRTPQTTNAKLPTYGSEESNNNINNNNNNIFHNNDNQDMIWSNNPLNRGQGSENSRKANTSAPVEQGAAAIPSATVPAATAPALAAGQPPTYLFNSINANKAALENIFQKEQFVSKF